MTPTYLKPHSFNFFLKRLNLYVLFIYCVWTPGYSHYPPDVLCGEGEVFIRKGTLATAADMLSGSCQAREPSMGSLPALMRIPMQEARFGRSRNVAYQKLDAQSKLETEDKYICLN